MRRFWTTSRSHLLRWSPTSGRIGGFFYCVFDNVIFRCYGVKIVPAAGAEKGDISELVETLATYLQNMEVRRGVILEWALHYSIKLQGNLKMVLRLTTTVAPTKLVLGIRKAILEKAGVPNFASDLRSC